MPDERPIETTNQTPGSQSKESRHSDPLRGLFWGLILIMLGVLFLAHESGWVVNDDNWWQFLLIGLGVIFLIDGGVRYSQRGYRAEGRGRFIPGIVLILVGVAFLFSFTQWWPLVLIGAGVAVLLTIILRSRTSN